MGSSFLLMEGIIMVTVVDPTGTPVPVYNRSGTTIVSLTGSSGTPTPIPHLGGTTVVLTNRGTPSGDAYELPSNAEIGDVVQIFAADNNGPDAYAASGDVILPNLGSRSMTASGGFFRKVSANGWVGG
jgi:hypothetical protein